MYARMQISFMTRVTPVHLCLLHQPLRTHMLIFFLDAIFSFLYSYCLYVISMHLQIYIKEYPSNFIGNIFYQ